MGLLRILSFSLILSTLPEDVLTEKKIVTSILETPFLMHSADTTEFEGYIVDLLNEISYATGFEFEIQLVRDGKYGAPDQNGSWNGMIRELIDREADIAAAGLTINYIRELVVDFTYPFLTSGIAGVVASKRTIQSQPGTFFFLTIFKVQVWILLLVACLVFAATMYLIIRFNPNENSSGSTTKGKTAKSQASSFASGLWFGFSSLMWQGYDKRPRSSGGRVLASFWFFFTFCTVILYTSAMVRSLSAYKPSPGPGRVVPFDSILEISKNEQYAIGAIAGGSTETFFRHSAIPVYQLLWNRMAYNSVRTFQEGIDRVRKSRFVFFGEVHALEYAASNLGCGELVRVGGILDDKGFGLATRSGSPYREVLNDAILQLKESQVLMRLYNKWWRRQTVCPARRLHTETMSQLKDKYRSNHLSLDEQIFAGPLIVYAIGILLAILTTVVEICLHRRGAQKTHGNEAEAREDKSRDEVKI